MQAGPDLNNETLLLKYCRGRKMFRILATLQACMNFSLKLDGQLLFPSLATEKT